MNTLNALETMTWYRLAVSSRNKEDAAACLESLSNLTDWTGTERIITDCINIILD